MAQPAHRDSRSGGALKVLGIGCAGVTVIGIAVAIYVGLHAREWAGDAARAILVVVIEESRLSEPQKVALTQRADRLTEDFKAELITLEQLGRIGERIVEGPIFDLALLMALESEAVLDAGLEIGQRDSASLEFQRYYRAVVEGAISPRELDRLVAQYLDNPADLEGIGAELTDVERDALVDDLKSGADAADVPAEPYEIDFAALFDEVVDGVLGGGG